MSTAVELAHRLGADERTVRRAIADGAVHARRLTPRTLDVPAEEWGYLDKHWRRLVEARRALRHEPNVRFAVLFGSVARGEEVEGSDADLVVELRDHSAIKLSRLRRRLERALGRPVELTYWEDARLSPMLMAELLRDGRVLVDRDSRWPGIKRSRDRIVREARKAERELFAQEREAIAHFARLATSSRASE